MNILFFGAFFGERVIVIKTLKRKKILFLKFIRIVKEPSEGFKDSSFLCHFAKIIHYFVLLVAQSFMACNKSIGILSPLPRVSSISPAPVVKFGVVYCFYPSFH